MALAAHNRISLADKRDDFFKSGLSLHSPFFTIIYLKNESEQPQFVVSVSKKVARKAHDRNKIRRQLLQLIQENLSLFPFFRYLFLPKKQILEATHQEIFASFSTLLSKLKQ